MSEGAALDPSKGGRRWLRLAPVALILAVFVAVLFSGAWKQLSLEDLKAHRDTLRGFVAAHPTESVALFVLAYCALVAFSLPGALIMSLSGGFLFGPLMGGLAGIVGVSAGAILMFLVARSALGEFILRRVPPGGMLARLERGIRRHAFSYLLTLRLIPAAPLWLVNIAASLVRMPLSTYAAATVIGVTPSTFIYASIGAGLDRLFLSGRRPDLGQLMRPDVLAPLAALAVLAVAAVLVQAWRARRRQALETAGSSRPGI